MQKSPVESQVTELLRQTLEDLGYRLVRVKMYDGANRRLQLMIERLEGSAVTVDDCADVSHTASAILDVHEPVAGAYHLEVSSPGIDRPLTQEADFVRYAGFDAKLETALPIEGRKRFGGTLRGVNAGDVVMEIDRQEHRIPLDAISTAKLVITDALLAHHAQHNA